MKEFTVTRYGFKELTPEAQAYAVQNERNDLYNNMPEEFITEDIRQELAEQLGGDYVSTIGLELRYSLGYSQGDGVSFTGRLTPATAPALTWPEGAAYAEIISLTRQYSHANTVRADLFDDEGEELDGPAVEVFREQIKDLCRILERVGYKSIEDYSSEASARDWRVAHSGAWGVYGVVNGYLLSRTYYGSTKREAVRLWREEAGE